LPDSSIGPLRDSPFPHVLVDDWLEPALYAAIEQRFPLCPPNSGPTGFTLHWGDPDYDSLIASDPAWAALFRHFHDQAHVTAAIARFADVFAAEATVDLSRARYVPYQESRADKERGRLARVEHDPDELWVRLDIMQGRLGYCREPHLDHRRRATSMLLYCCDAEENEMVGGDLILHGADGATEAVRPRRNRMVMFPCAPWSLHSVSPILALSAPRNFVQVTISSSVDIWPVEAPSRWQAVAGKARAIAKRVLAQA
jgi:hypothetical protein